MDLIDEIGGYFYYEIITKIFSKKEIKGRILSLDKSFNQVTSDWNSDKNSEWMLREYLSIKMILSSSILLSSAQFSIQRNLRVVEPYLIYYSLLNCARAVIFTSPLQEWKNGTLINLSHKKTISIVSDIVKRYNKEIGEKIKNDINLAREYREVYSYRFPANGLSNKSPKLSTTIETCKLLSEIAQFQSQFLENNSCHLDEYEGFDWTKMELGYIYGEKGLSIVDREDRYRLSYMERKIKKPYNLHMMMTEGLIEDFFGAWYPEDDTNINELYNPDANWQIIFPVP